MIVIRMSQLRPSGTSPGPALRRSSTAPARGPPRALTARLLLTEPAHVPDHHRDRREEEDHGNSGPPPVVIALEEPTDHPFGHQDRAFASAFAG